MPTFERINQQKSEGNRMQIEDEKILMVAKQLAKTNLSDKAELKKNGYSSKDINEYLERKNYHILNMLHLLKIGKQWTSYPSIYYKARKKAKSESRNPFFPDEDYI